MVCYALLLTVLFYCLKFKFGRLEFYINMMCATIANKICENIQLNSQYILDLNIFKHSQKMDGLGDIQTYKVQLEQVDNRLHIF